MAPIPKDPLSPPVASLSLLIGYRYVDVHLCNTAILQRILEQVLLVAAQMNESGVTETSPKRRRLRMELKHCRMKVRQG